MANSEKNLPPNCKKPRQRLRANRGLASYSFAAVTEDPGVLQYRRFVKTTRMVQKNRPPESGNDSQIQIQLFFYILSNHFYHG